MSCSSATKLGTCLTLICSRVEHANFEFSLGIEIRRDPHVIQMLHDNIPKPPQRIIKQVEADAASCTSAVRTGGIRNLFGSPRKMSKAPRPVSMVTEVIETLAAPVKENICHYFPPGESTIGKTHIAFKPIAKNCDTRLLEIRYPMFGFLRYGDGVAGPALQKGDRPSSHPSSGANAATAPPVRKQVCKVTLQIFRLPALPGLTQEQLPQSIDECLRGMRHHAWHEHEYHEGLLTQKGGDSHVSGVTISSGSALIDICTAYRFRGGENSKLLAVTWSLGML